MTKALAGVNVADVHFDGRNFHRRQSVMQGDRGMGIAPGIDDDPGRLCGMRLVDEIDQFAFAIGLPAIGLQAELLRGLGAKFLDIGKCRMAIGLRLAHPQQIEVRAVEHVNRLGSCVGHPNPGNVAVGGAVIGNNSTKGKPLGRLGPASNASSGSQKGAHNLWKSHVNQCCGWRGGANPPRLAWFLARRCVTQKGAGIACPPRTRCYVRR